MLGRITTRALSTGARQVIPSPLEMANGQWPCCCGSMRFMQIIRMKRMRMKIASTFLIVRELFKKLVREKVRPKDKLPSDPPPFVLFYKKGTPVES